MAKGGIMHIFGVGDIIFRDTPRRRNLLILVADQIAQKECEDYDTGNMETYAYPVYTVLDLDNGSIYDMDTDLETGDKVA